MLNLGGTALKVFLVLEPCDMRRSFNGLSELASRHHDSDPGRDALFVFASLDSLTPRVMIPLT